MARSAEQTLRVLMDKHVRYQPGLPFPRHCFLYSIHWSSSFLSIFAHFPYVTDARKQIRYRQVLLAQHWLGIPRVHLHERQPIAYGRRHLESDLFVCRWRIAVALFSIRAHMKLLASELSLEEGTNKLSIQSSSQVRSAELSFRTPPLLLNRGCTKLSILRSIWNRPTYQVPECWIVCF